MSILHAAYAVNGKGTALARALIAIFVLGMVWAIVGLIAAPGHALAVFPAAIMLVLAPIGLVLVLLVKYVLIFAAVLRGEHVDDPFLDGYQREADEDDPDEDEEFH